MDEPKKPLKALSEALDDVESETRSVVAREKDLAELRDRECESSRARIAPKCAHCLHVQGECEARLDLARGRLRDAKGRALALVAEASPRAGA